MAQFLPSLTTAVKRRFIKHLANTGTIAAAAKLAGVHRRTAERWRESDPVFKARFDEAMNTAMDKVESALMHRAVEGTMEYVVSAGRVVTDAKGDPLKIYRYSDTAAIALLKARRRDVFGDKSTVDMNLNTDPSSMTDEQLAAIASRRGPSSS